MSMYREMPKAKLLTLLTTRAVKFFVCDVCDVAYVLWLGSFILIMKSVALDASQI